MSHYECIYDSISGGSDPTTTLFGEPAYGDQPSFACLVASDSFQATESWSIAPVEFTSS